MITTVFHDLVIYHALRNRSIWWQKSPHHPTGNLMVVYQMEQKCQRGRNLLRNNCPPARRRVFTMFTDHCSPLVWPIFHVFHWSRSRSRPMRSLRSMMNWWRLLVRSCAVFRGGTKVSILKERWRSPSLDDSWEWCPPIKRGLSKVWTQTGHIYKVG